MQWRQWEPLSATSTPQDLCHYRPSDPVYCKGENNISRTRSEIPGQGERERNQRCEWHRVTNTLNPDNRKLMQVPQLKAQHISGDTLKLTLPSRWHMLIPWPGPWFSLWFSASGCPPKLLAHWPHKDRACRYWSRPVNTNVGGSAFPPKNKFQQGISNSTNLKQKEGWQFWNKITLLKWSTFCSSESNAH